MTLMLDTDGRIAQLGIKAHACAIGQASAAIFASQASGLGRAAIDAARQSITEWLGGVGPQPDWQGLDALAAARDFPARHGAMLLAWNAALDALPSA